MPLSKSQPSSARADGQTLLERFAATRQLSEALVESLSEADATLQSMEDASPAKWHLAHTTWFWETFLLREYAADYRIFDDRYPFLFNSYYEAKGARIARDQRGMLSRPSLAEIMDWRHSVDHAMVSLIRSGEHDDLVALGIAHEEQHIELLLTDIKHAFFQNPLGPAMWDDRAPTQSQPHERAWHTHPGGVARIGHQDDGPVLHYRTQTHRP
ncbi:MAG: DinB family protein, partial [Pseudomonadota bacterium]